MMEQGIQPQSCLFGVIHIFRRHAIAEFAQTNRYSYNQIIYVHMCIYIYKYICIPLNISVYLCRQVHALSMLLYIHTYIYSAKHGYKKGSQQRIKGNVHPPKQVYRYIGLIYPVKQGQSLDMAKVSIKRASSSLVLLSTIVFMRCNQWQQIFRATETDVGAQFGQHPSATWQPGVIKRGNAKSLPLMDDLRTRTSVYFGDFPASHV